MTRVKPYILLLSLVSVCSCRFDYDAYSGATASLGGIASGFAGMTGTGGRSDRGSSAASSSGGASLLSNAGGSATSGGAPSSVGSSGGTASPGSVAGGGANASGGVSPITGGGANASGGVSSAVNSGTVASGGAASTGGMQSTGGTVNVVDIGGAATTGGASAVGGTTGAGGSDAATSGGVATSGGASTVGGTAGAGASGNSTSGAANGGTSSSPQVTGGTATFGTGGNTSESVLLVTTSTDEGDSNATPLSPGGSGFSLREAITYANQISGQQTIQIPTGYDVALTSMLPELVDAAGAIIVGEGALLDGSGFLGFNPCLRIQSDNNRIEGLEISGCARSPIEITSGQNNQIDGVDAHDNGGAIAVSSANNRIGPGNTITTSGQYGVSITASSTLVDENWIVGNSNVGILLTGTADATHVIGNVLAQNLGGVEIGTGCTDVVIYNNVIDGNRSYGVTISATVSGTDFRANLITSNGGNGVSGFDSCFAVRDYNDWWNNASGPCAHCSGLASHDLAVDPMYVDASAGDYHLMSASPVRDAGPDLGVDTNGSAPGNYWMLPPMGAFDVQP